MVLVSACLWGEHTRYDGRSSLCGELKQALAERTVLLVCPEVMGGLSVPRLPARFVDAHYGQEGSEILANCAKLQDCNGRNVTHAYVKGAQAVLALALGQRVKRAYLKDRSPSCGYDPEGRNPRGGPGLGVLSALLLQHGVEVIEVRASSVDS